VLTITVTDSEVVVSSAKEAEAPKLHWNPKESLCSVVNIACSVKTVAGKSRIG
jgi:hypothetical protein